MLATTSSITSTKIFGVYGVIRIILPKVDPTSAFLAFCFHSSIWISAKSVFIIAATAKFYIEVSDSTKKIATRKLKFNITLGVGLAKASVHQGLLA